MIAARRIAVVIVGSLFALACQVTVASAATSYKLVGSFGELTTPTDVTVDQSNGNVYVTDSGANAVYVFGSEGGAPAGGVVSPITGAPAHSFHFGGEPSAVAIDESGSSSSNRDLYVSDATHNVVDKFQLNGTTHEYEYICQITGFGSGCLAEGGAPTWQEPDGVAVDATGNLYVASFGPSFGALSVFDSAGSDVQQILGEPSNNIRGPVGVAVAPDGTLYINDYHRQVVKLVLAGAESILDSNGSTAVAVDGHGNAFVNDRAYIAKYSQIGEQVGRFGEGEIGGSSEGVAVNNTTEDVYVTDRSTGTVKIFQPVEVPDVTTEQAEPVGKRAATVRGSVNPVGAGAATYFFQYGANTEYGNETSEESAGSGSASVPVSANLSGLEPGTTYHYRLVARNANGSNYGLDRTFSTLPAVTFKTCPPINLRGTSVTLCVLIEPEGMETLYRFIYGLTTEYTEATPFESTGPLTEEAQFTAPIAGLLPATTYHYQVQAFNELGFTAGQDETFTTPPAEPTVNDQSPFATGISLHEATLHGTVNPGNGVTTYHFDYGPTAAYGASTPDAYTQLNFEDDAGEQLITGLQAGTTYHYRLVATNSSGTTTGPDETFATLDGTPPAVETGAATQVSSSSATIAGVVDPAGESASYEFEVGTSESYGTQLFGSISSREEVAIGLSGLLPETLYHYRLVASSAAGTVRGADRTFTTSGYPVTIVQPGTPSLLPIPVFPPEGRIRLTCKKGLVKKGNKCVRKKQKHHARPKKHKKK